MQSNLIKTGSRRAAGIFFLCGILLTPVLRAQGTSSSTREEAHPKFWSRFSVGARLTILAMDNQGSGTVSSSPNSDTEISQTLTPGTTRMGGGLTVEYAARPRVLVSVDVLYSWFSYTSNLITNVTAADGISTITGTNEATSARYWDLPILARYTTRPARLASTRLLLGGGVSFRRASDVKTSTLTLNADGSQTASQTPRTLTNQTIYGVEATAGVRVKDEFGIKVTPEVRYIRWLNDLFTGWPGQQRRNELQVVVGLTF